MVPIIHPHATLANLIEAKEEIKHKIEALEVLTQAFTDKVAQVLGLQGQHLKMETKLLKANH